MTCVFDEDNQPELLLEKNLALYNYLLGQGVKQKLTLQMLVILMELLAHHKKCFMFYRHAATYSLCSKVHGSLLVVDSSVFSDAKTFFTFVKKERKK